MYNKNKIFFLDISARSDGDGDGGDGDWSRDDTDGVDNCDERTTGFKSNFGTMSGDQNGYPSNNIVIIVNDNHTKSSNNNSDNSSAIIKILTINQITKMLEYLVTVTGITIITITLLLREILTSIVLCGHSQIVHLYPIETVGNPVITLCSNDITDNDKLFVIQRLHLYYNYNYTITNHNNQAPTKLELFAYGSYHFSSIKNASIELNSNLGEDAYDINMILHLDIIDTILQHYKVFSAQFYSHYSNNFDSQIQYYF